MSEEVKIPDGVANDEAGILDRQEAVQKAEDEAPLEKEAANKEASPDFALLVQEDVRILREQFSELSSLGDITELENPLRYAALRDLGLTPEEAYLATSRKKRQDNRSHLYPTVPTHSAPPVSAMSESELAAAREIFPSSSDAEIRRLYRKVTK